MGVSVSLDSFWVGLGGAIIDPALEGLIVLEFLVRIIPKQERAGVREAMVEAYHIGSPDLVVGSHVLTRHPSSSLGEMVTVVLTPRYVVGIPGDHI